MADVKKNSGKKNNKRKFVKKTLLFQPGEMKCGEFEYKMSPQAAWSILHDPVTGKKLPGDDATLLCGFVNEQYGLKGTCVAVIVG